MPGVPVGECVRHLVPDELREIWTKHGVCSILPATRWISGNTCDCVERRQLGIRKSKKRIQAVPLYDYMVFLCFVAVI